jgi:hypothetical protein
MIPEISVKDIEAICVRFKELADTYPGLIEPVSTSGLKRVVDYLFDPCTGPVEGDTWGRITEGHIYSYACFVHEITEIQLREKGEPRIIHHGKALLEQYSLLSEYIKRETRKEYDVILLCCADNWMEDPPGGIKRDYSNAEKLEKYLKHYDKERYNKEKHTYNAWSNVSFGLREIMNSIRKTGGMP